MVYCTQGALAFSTAARRDTVLADMQARVEGRSRWGVGVLESCDFRPRLGQHGIRVALRFLSRFDADDLKARIEAFATGPRAPLAGSWVEVQDCTHDQGTNDCVVVARKEW